MTGRSIARESILILRIIHAISEIYYIRIDPSRWIGKVVTMKKYLLGLFVCFFSIALSCNAFAFPEYGNDCAQCHGAPVDSNPPPVEPDPPPAVSNNPPVADAGPDQSVDEGVAVTLDGPHSKGRDHCTKSKFFRYEYK